MKKPNRKERRAEKYGRKQGQVMAEVGTKELSRPSILIEPMNNTQKEYLISLYGDPCVICTGSAGTGKTYLAASVAAKDLAERRIKRIILSRANVPTGKSFGAFPGTIEEKMEPWLLPITDVLRLQLGDEFYQHARKTGAITVQPLETIRGRSFDDARVLLDEGQQLNVDELKAITTRIGENSKLFIMGDRHQRDVTSDGLKWLKELISTHDLPVAYHEFSSDDIVRSGLCKQFVKAFERDVA